MAESAVSFAVERIGDALLQKAIFLKGVHEQVDRMQRELKRMQCFLKDADAKQQEDERVRHWVSEIRDVAYDAEDAIDAFIFNVESGRTKFFPCRMFKKLVSSCKVGKEIEAIQIKIQDISKSRETYGINSIGEAISQAGQRLQKLRYISPLVKEEIIVGLKEDTDKLVEELVKGDERRRAVSMVGMDEARKIEKMQEHEFGDFLHELLKEQRFLVVLDDVWESDDWERLAKAFPKESNGSRLLLTTRKNDVALQADAQSVPYEVQLLSEAESWKLFCRNGEEMCWFTIGYCCIGRLVVIQKAVADYVGRSVQQTPGALRRKQWSRCNIELNSQSPFLCINPVLDHESDIVDVNACHRWISSLPYASEWHKIRRYLTHLCSNFIFDYSYIQD
ncbi:unnamed protein product, partial [Vitis vinifera]